MRGGDRTALGESENHSSITIFRFCGDGPLLLACATHQISLQKNMSNRLFEMQMDTEYYNNNIMITTHSYLNAHIKSHFIFIWVGPGSGLIGLS